MITRAHVKNIIFDEGGSVTILVVALLPILLLLMGLSIDIGRVLAAKAELYKANDVAAREIARQIDLERASRTGEQEQHVSTENAVAWVQENLDGLSGAKLLDVNVVNTEGFVEVESRAEVPLLFSLLANRRSSTIKVRSIGRLKKYTTG